MALHTFVVLAYKESDKLEECVISVLNQSVKSDVVIATSTINTLIRKIARKYNLKIIENPNPGKGIGYDFDFASNCVESELVTIAHQDDVYDYDYAKKVINMYKKYPESIIIFTDYYEIKGNNKVYSNTNLRIKRILLFPLRWHYISKYRFIKRSALRFGTAICCPAVTFVSKNTPEDKFKSDMKCDIDWLAWEKLSKLNGSFIYIKDRLMGHRISDESTTTAIINDGIRTKEDLIMFNKFWPSFIAAFINRLYKQSEKNNFKK